MVLLVGMLLPQLPAQKTTQDIFLYIPHIQPITNNGNTLYVGGSGPNNYTTIQEAINDAVADDTIYVYNGTYSENLNIGKRISVLGENPDNTFINGISGDDKVIKITVDDVTINNFTISGDPSGQDGIEISVPVLFIEYASITNNHIKNCISGIKLQRCNYITICDNEISDCSQNGFNLQTSNRNYICNNEIVDCADAAILLNSISNLNNISNNEIKNCNGGLQITLNSEQNTISYNQIIENDLEGIIVESLSNGNSIEQNNITDNLAGLKISGCSGTTVTGNTIADNRFEGVIIEKLSSNTIITENNFIGNKRHAKFRFSSRTIWENNYWDNWIGIKIPRPLIQKLPKVIVGFLAINFDRTPALEPHT